LAQRIIAAESALRSRDDIGRIRLAYAHTKTVGTRSLAVVGGSRLSTATGQIVRRRMQVLRLTAKNKLMGAGERARHGIEWARSHPLKAGAAVFGAAAGAIVLPIGAVVGGAAAAVGGVAAAVPAVAGGVYAAGPLAVGGVASAAVWARQRRDRAKPEAAERRRAERSELYRQAAELSKKKSEASRESGQEALQQRIRLRDAFGSKSIRPRDVKVVPSSGPYGPVSGNANGPVTRPVRRDAYSPGRVGSTQRPARRFGIPVRAVPGARGQHRVGRDDRPQVSLSQVLATVRPDPGQWVAAGSGRTAAPTAERTRSRATDRRKKDASEWRIPDSWRNDARRVRRESVIASPVVTAATRSDAVWRAPAHTAK
jgi:hypothetical protein